jgi:hypothetical protein
MARLSKTEALYNAILDSETASQSEKLEAARLLDAHRKNKGAVKRHGKLKKMLGLKAKDRIKGAVLRTSSDVDLLSKERRGMFTKVLELEKQAEPTPDDLKRVELGKNPTPENLAELTALISQASRKKLAQELVTEVSTAKTRR